MNTTDRQATTSKGFLMNSLTVLTLLAAFTWGYFTGMSGKQTT